MGLAVAVKRSFRVKTFDIAGYGMREWMDIAEFLRIPENRCPQNDPVGPIGSGQERDVLLRRVGRTRRDKRKP